MSHAKLLSSVCGGSESTEKEERLPHPATNPLCRPFASLTCTIIVIFISFTSLSHLSLSLLLPPSYSITLPRPSTTADDQRTHARRHTVITMQFVSCAYAWMAIKRLLCAGTSSALFFETTATDDSCVNARVRLSVRLCVYIYSVCLVLAFQTLSIPASPSTALL